MSAIEDWTGYKHIQLKEMSVDREQWRKKTRKWSAAVANPRRRKADQRGRERWREREREMSACSVCPSVRLSRSWIMSKRINISSKFFHHRVAASFSFFRTKRGGDILTWIPLTGASNAGGVGKKRDSGRIAGCIGHVCIGAYSISTA